MNTKEHHELSKERERTLSIYEEIKQLIPGFSDGIIPMNEFCDLERIALLTEELRSEAYLYYSSEVELNELMSIANDITNRVNLANYNPDDSFFIVSSVFDSIWHQKKSEELSIRNKRNLAKLAINVLSIKNEKYWIDNLAPSISNFNHCIYFILILEDRFRNENGEFEAVFNHLKIYIEKYGIKHHLSQRWIIRFNSLLKK